MYSKLHTDYHGVSVKLCDFDKLYESQEDTVLVNQLVTSRGVTVMEATNTLSSLIKTEISGANYNSTPRCTCGNLNTQYDADNDNVCPKCGSVCVKSIYTDIAEKLWIAPVAPVKAFIHPRFWLIFNKLFSTYKIAKIEAKKNNFDLLAWMCDPNYNCTEKVTGGNLKMINYLTDVINFKRGINEFITGYDRLMDQLLDPETFYTIQAVVIKRSKYGRSITRDQCESERRDFEAFSRKYRDILFPTKLPIISEKLIITEESDSDAKKQIDNVFLGIIDAAKAILSIYTHPNKSTKNRITVSRCVAACRLHATFNYNLRREIVFPKSAILRSKCNKTRASFSGRATISALAGRHKYNHCRTPWRWTVNLLYLDIQNILINRMGFTPNQSFRIIDFASNHYSKLVHDVINTLIKESPDDGIMLIPLRNPTLVRLSVWTLYMTEVCTDLDDGSIGLSNLIVKQANADYDGDQLQVMMPRDNVMRRLGNLLRAPLSLMSRAKVGEVASELTLHPENVANQYNFILNTVTDEEWEF